MTREKVMPTIEQSALALLDTQKILSQLLVPFILDGGTLLGFYRDHTFAADDHDDIDLTTSASQWKYKQIIIDDMIKAGFELYHEWPRDGMKKHSGQLAFKRDNVKIDLMFKEWDYEKNKVWWTVFGGKKGVTYKSVPDEFINIAKTFEVTILDEKTYLSIPEKVEEYLTYRYGDWRSPVHRRDYSCYKTDLAIVENYESI